MWSKKSEQHISEHEWNKLVNDRTTTVLRYGIEVKRCTYSNQYLFVFHFTVNLFYCSVVACITIFPSHQVRRVMQARVTGLDPITQFSGLCKRIFPGNPCLHFSRPHSLILMQASLMQASLMQASLMQASLCKPAYASQLYASQLMQASLYASQPYI